MSYVWSWYDDLKMYETIHPFYFTEDSNAQYVVRIYEKGGKNTLSLFVKIKYGKDILISYFLVWKQS